MSNDLVPATSAVETGLVLREQKHSIVDFKATLSNSFPARLQLMTARSEKCTDGSFPINHFALVLNNNFIDLGEMVDICPLAWRPKAVDMSDREDILTSYDLNEPLYSAIREKSALKDSGCMYGTEFLVWVPKENSFATIFCGTKSLRREAPLLAAKLDAAVPCTLKPEKAETAKYSWFTMKVTSCSQPVTWPKQSDYDREIEAFNNPPVSNTAIVEDEDTRAR